MPVSIVAVVVLVSCVSCACKTRKKKWIGTHTHNTTHTQHNIIFKTLPVLTRTDYRYQHEVPTTVYHSAFGNDFVQRYVQSLNTVMSPGHILVQAVVRIMPGLNPVRKPKSTHHATLYPSSLTPYCTHDIPTFIISSINLAHTSIAFSPNRSFHLISALLFPRFTLTFEHEHHEIILSCKSLQRRS